MSVPGFYRYWGKARPSDDSAAAHHLLAYHCLDVAAAGRVFLNRAPGLRRWLASAVGANEEAMVDWVCFWALLYKPRPKLVSLPPPASYETPMEGVNSKSVFT